MESWHLGKREYVDKKGERLSSALLILNQHVVACRKEESRQQAAIDDHNFAVNKTIMR